MSAPAYLVCATQRSGSTLLCEALKETGVAGRPLEFFEGRPATGTPPAPLDYLEGIGDPYVTGLLADAPPSPAPPYSDRRGLSWEEHLARSLRDGRTGNGVFAAKVMWNQLADLAELSGRREEPLELLQGLFAPTHWVWVRRRDVLRQAVSLWRALQTQTWRDVGAAVDAVLAHLSLEPVGDGGGEPPMKRRSDGISDEWAEAHRRGIAVRPHNTPHPLSPRK